MLALWVHFLITIFFYFSAGEVRSSRIGACGRTHRYKLGNGRVPDYARYTILPRGGGGADRALSGGADRAQGHRLRPG